MARLRLLLVALSLTLAAACSSGSGNGAGTDVTGGGSDSGGELACQPGTVAQYGTCVPVVCESDLCVAATLSRCLNEGTTLSAPQACPDNLVCGGVDACRESCTDHAHCVVDYVCVEGACERARQLGAPCEEGSQCVSGRCLDALDGGDGVCAGEEEERCLLSNGEGGAEWAEDGFRLCEGAAWRPCSQGVWGSAVDCRPAECQDGQLTPAETCTDGEGCVWTQSAPCPGHFACADEQSCRTWCGGEEDCATAGYACVDNACVLQGCDAGDAYCEDGAVWRCNAGGTAYELDETCTENQTCTAGECRDHVCEPNEQLCQGDAVVTCAADGLSFGEPDGCQAEHYCSGGVCRPWVCTPESTTCQGDRIAVCADNGSGYVPGDPCGADEYCDEGACHDRLCEPDAQSCSANTLVTCNSQGSGYASMEDCAPLYCVVDECTDRLCEPGESTCNEGAVVTCADDGMSWGGPELCEPGTICHEGDCVAPLCDEDERQCADEDTPQVCAADRMSWVDEADCEAGFWCQAGVCVERPSELDEDFETGDLSRFPWETTGPHAWVVSAGEGRGDSFAARTSPDHDADESAGLAVALSIRDTEPVSFWVQLETEDDHFELVFLIDDVEQARYSGVADWTQYSYAVGVGVHRFEWRYERDDFVSTEHPMRNSVWLDDIDFPGYNSAPTVPAGIWPFDNAVIADTLPTITWASEDVDPGDSILYEMQIDTTSAFSGATSTGEIWQAEYTPDSALVDGETYWWRARAKDDFDDAWGPWSGARSFTVRTDTPRPGWLQVAGEQLATGEVDGLLATDVWLINPANVLVVTTYDNGDGCNFVTVRTGYDTSEDAVYCTHAPEAGYEYNYYDWTNDLAYGYDGGFRFNNVPIPAGAHVASASLCLNQCYGCYGYPDYEDGVADLRVTADDVGNAGIWPDTGTQLTGYTPTSARVDWHITGVYESGQCIPSPDITAIVQEVADRADWNAGNSLRFLLEDLHGDGSYNYTEHWSRLFYSQGNRLEVNFDATGAVVSPPIRFADIEGAVRWDQAQWAGNGDVVVRVLDGDGALVSDLDLPGNGAGFTANTIPLWHLDPVDYPELRLEATLTRDGDAGVARLDEWSVTWGDELRWDFRNLNDAEGWIYGPETPDTALGVSSGVLRVVSDGDDPNLRLLGLNLDSAEFTELELRLRSGNIEIYDTVAVSWANEAGGFAAHARTSDEIFLLDWQTVTFDLLDTSAGIGTWEGTLLNLRVDPVALFDGESSWFEIDWVVLR